LHPTFGLLTPHFTYYRGGGKGKGKGQILKAHAGKSHFSSRRCSHDNLLLAELMDFVENTIFVPWCKKLCGGEKNMPHFIDAMCNTLADRLWLSRIRRPIEQVARNLVETKGKLNRQRSASVISTFVTRLTCFKSFRCWFLYHWMPYDLNLWTKARDFWFLLFNTCLCLPSAALHACFYTLVLSLIDRRDEYQLITYIRSYKAFQFFSAGVVGLVIGGLMYVQCLLFTDFPSTADMEASFEAYALRQDNETRRIAIQSIQQSAYECRAPRPMQYIAFDFEMVAFLFNIVLMWIAFFHLPYSQVNAHMSVGKKASMVQSVISTMQDRIRGRDVRKQQKAWPILKFLLIWDLTCFVLLVAAAVLVWGCTSEWEYREEDEWKFRVLAFWVKALYGLCAAPFAIFTLPCEYEVLFAFMTDARPTAYDAWGRLREKHVPNEVLRVKFTSLTKVALPDDAPPAGHKTSQRLKRPASISMQKKAALNKFSFACSDIKMESLKPNEAARKLYVNRATQRERKLSQARTMLSSRHEAIRFRVPHHQENELESWVEAVKSSLRVASGEPADEPADEPNSADTESTSVDNESAATDTESVAEASTPPLSLHHPSTKSPRTIYRVANGVAADTSQQHILRADFDTAVGAKKEATKKPPTPKSRGAVFKQGYLEVRLKAGECCHLPRFKWSLLITRPCLLRPFCVPGVCLPSPFALLPSRTLSPLLPIQSHLRVQDAVGSSARRRDPHLRESHQR
jgi:hypothetical protein